MTNKHNNPVKESLSPIIPITQVRSLIAYVLEHSLSDSQTINDLESAVHDLKSAEDEDARLAARMKINNGYSALTKTTYPVTGFTLEDTKYIWSYSWKIILLAVFFFSFAIASDVSALYFGDVAVPDEAGWESRIYFINSYLLPLITPLFWGGLGACVYLLKKMSDHAQDLTFDSRLLRGEYLRISIGALLGSIIHHIYDPTVFVISTEDINGNILAFLTGVGVKVVYGGLEKTIDSLGKAMNLDSLRTSKKAVKDDDS